MKSSRFAGRFQSEPLIEQSGERLVAFDDRFAWSKLGLGLSFPVSPDSMSTETG